MKKVSKKTKTPQQKTVVGPNPHWPEKAGFNNRPAFIKPVQFHGSRHRG